MDEENEILDSENKEEEMLDDGSSNYFDESTNNEDDIDALKEKNRQLFARAKKAEAEVKAKKAETPVVKTVQHPDDIAKAIDERFEKQQLDDLDVSDSLKLEVKNYAKLNGVSIKKALGSDYIQFQKDKEDKKNKVEEASLGNKGRGVVKKDYSNLDPTTIDPRTPEGKADFAKYEDHLRKELG